MALTVCPECSGKISDKAQECPHCGFPLANSTSLKSPTPSEPPATTDAHAPLPLARNVCWSHYNVFRNKYDHQCPHCGEKETADIELLGSNVICGHCRKPYRMPTMHVEHGILRNEALAENSDPTHELGSPWPAPQHPPAPPSGAPAKPTAYDGLSVTGFVLSLISAIVADGSVTAFGIFPVLAIIFSAIGLTRTAERTRKGHGLAVAGLVIGLLFLLVFILVQSQARH